MERDTISQTSPEAGSEQLPTPSSGLPTSASTLASSDTRATQDAIYHHIKSYPFHSDSAYQSGLSTILGHPSTPASQSELIDNADLVLQAQCFYFARKFRLGPIDVAAYKEFLAIPKTSPEESASAALAPDRNGSTNPLDKPDPVDRPSAPTPATASAASTLTVQPHSQAISSPPLAADVDADSGAAEGPSPPYPTSFADIVDLITQNKPIPGIETIPDTVLDPGSSKQDQTARRRKPWEQNAEAVPSEKVAADAAVASQSDVETGRQTGEGVLRILQPGAIPDSGLLAKE